MNREEIDENLIQLKTSMKDMPASEKRYIYWCLLKETMKRDVEGVKWFFEELGRFVVKELKEQ